MSGNGRLIQPNAVNVATTYADGPLAQPSNVAMQGPAGMQILVMGGLTKVEALAGQIAGGLISSSGDFGIVDCVNAAEGILAECAKRRQPKEDGA